MNQEEVFIPKMRRLDDKQKKIKIPILNFALIIFCVFLLIASTFVCINIQHYILPKSIWNGAHLEQNDFIYNFSIIPQIPVLMFVVSSLGKKMGTTSVILYIFAGLTLFPLFALGGGVQYIMEYSFGYILAYIPAVILAGQFLKNKYSFFNMFLASLCGVLIIHFCGVIYMALIAFLKHDGISFIKGWIAAQSGLKILYDLILSFVLVLIGKYINAFIKFIMH